MRRGAQTETCSPSLTWTLKAEERSQLLPQVGSLRNTEREGFGWCNKGGGGKQIMRPTKRQPDKNAPVFSWTVGGTDQAN